MVGPIGAVIATGLVPVAGVTAANAPEAKWLASQMP